MNDLPQHYQTLYRDLKTGIPSRRLFTSPLKTLAHGTDASVYRMTPQLVARVENEGEVVFALKTCRKHGIPVTFRAAGTSLAGQAVTEEVLIELGPSWRHYKTNDDGSKASFQAGIVGARANQYLKKYGRKLGPAPASINAAKISGIVGNNASGMSYGRINNSYNTIAGMRMIFYDGAILDTRDAESVAQFKETHPDMLAKLSELATYAKSEEEVKNKINKKFQLKNTSGYGVNSLIDFEDPIDILMHLMVGSEGTLAFISEVEFRTVVDEPVKATALLYFRDITTAAHAAYALRQYKVSAAELMDRAALRAVEDNDGMPEILKTLDEGATALLVETSGNTQEEVDKQIAQVKEVLQDYPMVEKAEFTQDIVQYNKLWKVRKGLFTSASAARREGTVVVIEDVAFPGESLGEALEMLQEMFARYGYDDTIIWGHALEGNIHFVLMQDFSDEQELSNYKKFMDELTKKVVKTFDGSLKAEHGTGRNMAPFVELEWGSAIYDIMKSVKKIIDPENFLNPGVLINSDPEIHTKNLKKIKLAHPVIDKCIECGFCDDSCVSKDLTLTPRQRIVVYRRMKELEESNQHPDELKSLRGEFEYDADETCATDGLCAISCPVDIDTGKFIKEMRHQKVQQSSQKAARYLATHMETVTQWIRVSLSTVNGFHTILGSGLMQGIANGVRGISGGLVPKWMPSMPKGSPKIPLNGNTAPGKSDKPKVVYFPSCINRSMGVAKGQEDKVPLVKKTVQLLEKAGYEVVYPPAMNKLCCGMAFSSKGYKELGQMKSNELQESLMTATENGRYPVLSDMSPCLATMKENMEESGLKLYEPVEFILKFLVDKLDFTPVDETVSVFAVCSAKKMGLEEGIVQLAQKCASRVVIPDTNCCGFAGDRGFTYPELNANGLKYLKEQTPETVKYGYSTSRTCEIGLSKHGGVPYQSIIYLVDKATSPKNATNKENASRDNVLME